MIKKISLISITVSICLPRIEEGRMEGRVKGREERVREANLNNARNLKKMGVTIDVISQATGLSKEEIEAL